MFDRASMDEEDGVDEEEDGVDEAEDGVHEEETETESVGMKCLTLPKGLFKDHYRAFQCPECLPTAPGSTINVS